MSTQLTDPPSIHKPRPLIPVEHPYDDHAHDADHGDRAPAADHDQIDLNVKHPTSGWIIFAAIAGVIVLASLLFAGIMPRRSIEEELTVNAQAELTAPVAVNVVTPRRADATMDVKLPGTLRPWQEVSIYSRSNGYLKKFYVDISNQVQKGQLMADISTPEVDQQLNGAQATLTLDIAAAEKAKTDLEFADQTDKRYESLRGTSGVTQQELDQYAANYKVAVAALNQAQAQVGVAKANVQQLTELVSFEKIIAPFSGVVTGRAFDVGAYIIANPTTADVPPMFKIAENDVLRAFINVPQNYSLTVKMGQKVTITARERAGRTFTGEVLGTTNYLDPSARSLLTEVRIENPDFALLPGMYVEATFHVTRDTPPLLIPAPALVVNADGNQVAIVKDGKVHFQKVTLGVDYGDNIEIVTGLNGDEQVIGNPGERTTEGADVVVSAGKR